ncbi:MAG: glycoside hydrolase family 13 protein [Candidatus Promineifilaceae bacterium]|nr:glycoside hydrolase family 13 protein [Candidatus Promineifilaceae bacterium]
MIGSQSRSTPAWVQDAIFYQIFPDRFAKSERLTKPANLQAWDDPPTQQGYHGGDLLGIVEKLDYLEELGVNALYLNPIFRSASNHRYHTHDYYQVDPLLGGNAALAELVEALHQRGMRLVLDGVFNHASRGFFQFNDILENGPHSAWLDWFVIQDWPLSPYDGDRPANYISWWGNRALPKFNTDNEQVREFIYDVATYWLREYDIDGWRLDVPAEIDTPGFWETFRQHVKEAKADAYLVGEIWNQAPDWLSGARFDGLMNYPFAAAVTAFVAGDRVSPTLVKGRSYDPYPPADAEAFAQRIDELLEGYAWPVTLSQLNLLDSHDTPRLLSLARGDAAGLSLATLLQMTFPGAPCIYYGDEIALRGTTAYDEPHDDADARWPFPWHERSRWNEELLKDVRQLVAMRHQEPVLRSGAFSPLRAKDHCYAFARHESNTALITIVNAGEEAHSDTLSLPEDLPPVDQFRVVFGRADLKVEESRSLTYAVAARSGTIVSIR